MQGGIDRNCVRIALYMLCHKNNDYFFNNSGAGKVNEENKYRKK